MGAPAEFRFASFIRPRSGVNQREGALEQTGDSFLDRRMRIRSSRSWRVMACVVLVIGLAACGSPSGGDPQASVDATNVDTVLNLPDLKGQTIVINSYGGSYGEALEKNVIKPFEAATGANVTLSTNCCSSFVQQVKDKQFAGDVVFGNDYGLMQAWADEKLLTSDPRLTEIAKARGVEPDHYQADLITMGYYAYVLAWNTQTAKEHPSSWQEFFDTEKFDGARGIPNSPVGLLDAASLGTGTAPSDLYPMDVNNALDAVSTLRDNARVQFWADGAGSMNQLGTGEVDYSLAFSNRVIAGIQQGLPVSMTFNGALRVATSAAIPATATNIDGAVAFLDFSMAPEIQAAFAKDSGMSPAYPEANKLVDPSMQKYMVTDPSNADNMINWDHEWWRKNTAATKAAFAEKVGG